MIQKELDLFEQRVLTDLFGGYTQDHFIIKAGIFKYNFGYKLQQIITEFENMVKPFMTPEGYVDGSKLRSIITIPGLEIPDRLFKFSDIYYQLQPILLKLKGFIIK